MPEFNLTCQNISCNEESDATTNKNVNLMCCFEIWLNEIKALPISKIQNWLAYYSSSYLVLPAIFFNLLSLLVLSNYFKRNRSSTTINCYMKYLCVVDILTIFLKFINEFIIVRNAFRNPQYELNSTICKMTPFAESLFGITSIYILVLMSFDKLICVAFPLKSSTLLIPKRARISSLVLIILSAIYSSHNVFNQKVDIEISMKMMNTSTYTCTEKNESIKNQIELIDNIIRVFIPIILLCICNASIIYFLMRARKRTTIIARSSSYLSVNSSNQLRKSSQVSKIHIKSPQEENLLTIPNTNRIFKERNSQSSISEEFSSNLNKSFMSIKSTGLNEINKNQHNNNCIIRVHNSKTDKKSNYMTVILLTVSFGFITLNLPYAIYSIYISKKLDILHKNASNKSEFSIIARYEFFGYVTHFLLDLNYIANFFFYFLSGSKFRSRLYSICSMTLKKNVKFFKYK